LAVAFARQALSDFEARDQLLRNSQLPECHQLHFLQMAMEKTAKAHLVEGGSDPLVIQSSHAYIAKVIPIIVRQALTNIPGPKSQWVIRAVRALARRIELLHPQVDDAGTAPSNCEYPWRDATGHVLAPAQYDFQLNLHAEKAAITMIKEVRARAIELSTE
jgi:hypothetical protein